MRKIGLLSLMVVCSTFLFGCEDKDESNLYKAQQCLNIATFATADTCLTFISGQTSEQSYALRCSAAFITQGVEEEAMVDAFQNIDGDQAGNPTAPAIAALAMNTTAASMAALDVCTLSGSKALTALANFANLATVMGVALGGLPADPTAAQVENLIKTYDPNTTATQAQKDALGAAVIASQESLCNSSNGLLKSTDTCKDINAAIAVNPGDAGAIADALIANIDN